MHAFHSEEIHRTKTKSPERSNHVLHKFFPPEIRERLPPSQRRYGQWYYVCVSRALLFLCGHRVEELGASEVQEEPNEIQDLSASAFRILESKESKGRCEVPKVLSDVQHKAGYFEIVHPRLLEVHECGKVAQGASAKPFGNELVGGETA